MPDPRVILNPPVDKAQRAAELRHLLDAVNRHMPGLPPNPHAAQARAENAAAETLDAILRRPEGDTP